MWGFFKYYCKNANSICFSTYCPEGPQELPTFVIAIIFDSRSTRISLNWKKFTDTSLVSHETWLRCHNSKKLLQLLIKFGNYGNSINPKKLWVYWWNRIWFYIDAIFSPLLLNWFRSYIALSNAWCNKNQTKHSSKTLLCLVWFLLHQTLLTYTYMIIMYLYVIWT